MRAQIGFREIQSQGVSVVGKGTGTCFYFLSFQLCCLNQPLHFMPICPLSLVPVGVIPLSAWPDLKGRASLSA